MAGSTALRLSALTALIACAGCAKAPPDYSPDYSYVSTTSFSSAKSVTGEAVLVPNACLNAPADLGPDPAETPTTFVPRLGPHLPPGCANAYNLQQMVENQRDLVEGRPLGPAAAAPTVRAARRYLYGEDIPLGGAHNTVGDPGPSAD